MKYETVVVGALETNCYLAYCEQTGKCAVIDPGADPGRILSSIHRLGLEPVLVLNTHGHLDHIGANRDIKEKFNIPLSIHAADSPMLSELQNQELRFLLGVQDSPPADSFLVEGEEIPVGGSSLRVLHTPGHSPGSVSFLADSFLLSGDTLFCGGVGRTDLPGGSFKQLEDSIRNRILVLEESMLVLPGHGPTTTIGQEKHSNPFLT